MGSLSVLFWALGEAQPLTTSILCSYFPLSASVLEHMALYRFFYLFYHLYVCCSWEEGWDRNVTRSKHRNKLSKCEYNPLLAQKKHKVAVIVACLLQVRSHTPACMKGVLGNLPAPMSLLAIIASTLGNAHSSVRSACALSPVRITSPSMWRNTCNWCPNPGLQWTFWANRRSWRRGW